MAHPKISENFTLDKFAQHQNCYNTLFFNVFKKLAQIVLNKKQDSNKCLTHQPTGVTIMKAKQNILSVVALAAAISCMGVAHGAMQSFTALPSPNCGTTQTNNCVQFGDFSVYSLALLYTQATFASTGIIPTSNPNPGDPYYVKSAPGELSQNGYIVYGTGTNNNNVVTNGAGTLIDDAQAQATGAVSSFVVGAGTETSPTFTGDSPTSWSGTLSAIRTELGAGSTPNGQFVIYFNLNETGADGLAGIDLLTWLRVTLTDAQGILPNLDYYLTGNPGSTTAPSVTNDSDPNWVTAHGTICVSATAGFLGFGPCTTGQTTSGGRNVNQNLGANAAAFAIYNANLSNMVLNSGYDYIQGNWQFSNINNGFEQQFSALATVNGVNRVPEPATLGLLGLGLLGMGASLRKRKAV